MLLTRPPLFPKEALDLHVLSPPLAFALSQDQTLQFDLYSIFGARTRLAVFFLDFKDRRPEGRWRLVILARCQSLQPKPPPFNANRVDRKSRFCVAAAK